jgi:hypothetical protein
MSTKTRAEVLVGLADVVEALCDPRPHVERIPYWDTNRNRKWREHRTTQAGLLAQLAELFPASGAQIETGGSASKPAFGSRPPGAFEAVALHTEITIGAAKWCWNLELDQRDTVEGNLRGLVGAAARVDADRAAELLVELDGWRRRAEVVIGWRSPAFWPRVACPVCNAYQAVGVNLDRKAAWCRSCRSTWDAATIGVLAEYVRKVGDNRPAPTSRAAA